MPLPSRRRIYLALGLGMALLAACIAHFQPTAPPDPVHEGKRVSEWITLAAVFEPSTPLAELDEQREAQAALVRAGSAALPLVQHHLERLSPKGLERRKAYASFWNKRVYLQRVLPRPDTVELKFHRRPLIEVVAKIGPPAASLVSTLEDYLLHSPGEGIYAGWALGEIGPAASNAVPALLSCLNGHGRLTRVFALSSVAIIGVVDSAQLAVIKAARKDENELVSGTACIVAWELQPTEANFEMFKAKFDSVSEEVTRVGLMNHLARRAPERGRAVAFLEATAAATNATDAVREAARRGILTLTGAN